MLLHLSIVGAVNRQVNEVEPTRHEIGSITSRTPSMLPWKVQKKS